MIQKTTKKCGECHRSFEPYKSGRQKFCSSRCYGDFRTQEKDTYKKRMKKIFEERNLVRINYENMLVDGISIKDIKDAPCLVFDLVKGIKVIVGYRK